AGESSSSHLGASSRWCQTCSEGPSFLSLDHPALVVEVVCRVRLRLLSLRRQHSEGAEGSPCGQDDAPPGTRRLGCRERLTLQPSPLLLLRAHDRETTTTRWPGGSFTSPSARGVHGVGEAEKVADAAEF